MPRVRYSPAATDDLDGISLFLASEADLETAKRFLKKIELACEKIALAPVGFRLRPEFASDLRSFPFGSYLVFYFPEKAGINVVRIVHSARDLDTLFEGWHYEQD